MAYTACMPRSLTHSERTLFLQIADAVFSNPFGRRREGFDAKILGTTERLPHAERSRRLRDRVAAAIAPLERDGSARLDLHPPEDQRILEVALLFLGYQESFDDLDAHIDAELTAAATSPFDDRASGPPRRPSVFPPARAHIDRLLARGFSIDEAERYFAIFFQLRRAHRFIDQGLIGRSDSMIELRRQLWHAAVSADMGVYGKQLFDRMEDFSTLLLGETGAGKGRAAAALGRSGFIPFDRARGAFAECFTESFLQTNLSQFPEALLPSELFGHRKGAFTGAIDDHEGVFARCSPYGSILLDEIGEVSVPVQIQLLRVLQERTFTPVGGTEAQRFRGRVIAATNQSIHALRREGAFRDDFYYRLTSEVITVPPLRTRLAEDPAEREVLVSTLIARIVGARDTALTDRVLSALDADVPVEHPWPGNVRELEQAVRRILLSRRYHPEPTGDPGGDPTTIPGLAEGSIDARTLVGRYCAMLYRRSGNLAEVARRTGLDRRTVRKHLEEQGEVVARGER